MTYQTGSNLVIDLKPEATFNTAPGSSGSTQMRFIPGPGLSMDRAMIESQEIAPDMLARMARLGSRKITGSYLAEASVGSHDMLFEAVMRSTWAAALAITQATAGLTSITTTTSTIVASAGSWITAGVARGDVVRLTGHSTVANNSINLRVKTVTALTLTMYGTPLTLDATPDTTFTLTVLKKLKNGATPVRRSFYVDQYMQDADQSEAYGGVRFISMKVTGAPNGMAQIEFGALGASMTPLATGSSPYYSSPTTYSSIALTFADATISMGGVDQVAVTAWELNYIIDADTLDVIGASVTPDVFDNKAMLNGKITVARTDLTNLTNFANEVEFDFHVLLVEPESEPKDCIALYVPRAKLTGVQKQLGQKGAMLEDMPWTAGKSIGVSGVDDSLMTILTSAA